MCNHVWMDCDWRFVVCLLCGGCVDGVCVLRVSANNQGAIRGRSYGLAEV